MLRAAHVIKRIRREEGVRSECGGVPTLTPVSATFQ